MTSKNDEQEISAEFDIKDLVGIAIILVIIGAVLIFGTSMQVELRDDIQADLDTEQANRTLQDTTALVAANNSIAGIAKISGKQALIASVIVIAVVIGILIRYLYANFAGKKGEM